VSAGGCGSGACQCRETAAPVPASAPVAVEAAASKVPTEVACAAINGVALHLPGERPDEYTLRELAWAELLRQEAVARRLLPHSDAHLAPHLGPAEQAVIQQMLDDEIEVPAASEDECRRYYAARSAHFALGRRVHARHILFAVTEGINVAALAAHAEKALIELRHKEVAPGRFAELARTLSNCPSGADGGDLGWIGPDDCADELAAELFHTSEELDAVGLHPRLVHSRYGFHIVEVLARDAGRRQTFEEVGQRIAVQLAQQSRAKALHQYMQLLAGGAQVNGLVLEGADSPLVQ
jgi:peptidyl-prolyl cis-trans isomerase C